MEIRFKHVIPPLSADEFTQLEANILQDGIRDPLVLWGDVLVDGHNRHEIAGKHGLSFDTVQMDFPDEKAAVEWIILNQFGRRNLPAYERARLALELKPIIAEKAKENQKQAGGAVPQKSAKAVDTRNELAAIAGVSHDTIAKVERIEKDAPAEIKAKIKSGDMSINQAYQTIKREEKTRAVMDGIERQRREIENGAVLPPDGLFDVIAIDPPWNYGTNYDAGGRRVGNPYPEMTQEELRTLEIPAADNSIIFLWTTHRFIWDAKELLDRWGFIYRNIVVWDKQKLGMGDLFRMQCEFCLVGIKGNPLLDNDHTFRDIIEEPRREHSRKPEKFYEMVNALCVGRKLDYFSRQQRAGWVAYGNDANKF